MYRHASLCLLSSMLLAAEPAAEPPVTTPDPAPAPAAEPAPAAAAPAPAEQAAAVDPVAAATNATAKTVAPDAQTLVAERDGATLLDIDQAVAKALADQLAVQAARYRRQGAERSADSRMAFARPQVQATASYSYVNGIYNQRAALPGVDDPDNRWNGAVQARQLLYGFGARSAASALGRSDIAQAESNLRLTERQIAYQTRLAVGRVWHGRARVEIAMARALLREEELSDATQLFQAGRIAAIDVRQSEISLIQAQDQLAGEKTFLGQLAEDLALLLNMEPVGIAISGSLERVTTLDTLIAAARAQAGSNSDVLALDAALMGNEAAIRSLSAADRPQFYAFGSAGIDGNETDDLDDGYAIGLELGWTFDGGGRIDQRAQAREEALALQSQRKLTEDSNLARIQQLEIDIRSLNTRIAEQQRAVVLAEQNYTDTRQLYTAGRVTLTRVSEANFNVTQARFQLIDLIFQENLAAFELQLLAE